MSVTTSHWAIGQLAARQSGLPRWKPGGRNGLDENFAFRTSHGPRAAAGEWRQQRARKAPLLLGTASFCSLTGAGRRRRGRRCSSSRQSGPVPARPRNNKGQQTLGRSLGTAFAFLRALKHHDGRRSGATPASCEHRRRRLKIGATIAALGKGAAGPPCSGPWALLRAAWLARSGDPQRPW